MEKKICLFIQTDHWIRTCFVISICSFSVMLITHTGHILNVINKRCGNISFFLLIASLNNVDFIRSCSDLKSWQKSNIIFILPRRQTCASECPNNWIVSQIDTIAFRIRVTCMLCVLYVEEKIRIQCQNLVAKMDIWCVRKSLCTIVNMHSHSPHNICVCIVYFMHTLYVWRVSFVDLS